MPFLSLRKTLESLQLKPFLISLWWHGEVGGILYTYHVGTKYKQRLALRKFGFIFFFYGTEFAFAF